MAEPTIEAMRTLLQPLKPLELQIEDESEQHAGHPGARGGAGHFRLRLVSERFPGLSRVQPDSTRATSAHRWRHRKEPLPLHAQESGRAS